MNYLPDVNVWIAFAAGHHTHHSVAKRWFDNAADRMVFCRVTELGLFRMLTNTRVMDGNALTADEAWTIRMQFQSDPRIGFAIEPAGFDVHWRRTANPGSIGPNFWTDAYLISLCASTESTLVTFDRALARSKDCRIRLLDGK